MAQTYHGLTDFPGEARDDAVAELIDGHIYYGTGYDGSFSARKDFWRYSLESGEWEQLSEASFSPRQYSSSAAVGNHLFVIAGWSNSQDFHKEMWRLDTRDLSWERVSDFPGAPRWAAVAVENESLIYFGLGRDTAQLYKDWWRYDPKTNEWHELPSLPGTSRGVAFAETVDDRIYVGMGEDSARNALNDLWVFDISTSGWSEVNIPNMPALKHPATVVVQDKIYIAGGESPNSLTTDLLELDTHEKELTDHGSLGFRQARGSNMLSDGCRLYLIGGLSEDFQRINDFGVIEFPAFRAALPEVFPNPADDELNVRHPEEAERVQIFDITGSLVMEAKTCCEQTDLRLERLRTGSYLVRWCGETCSKLVKVQVVR